MQFNVYQQRRPIHIPHTEEDYEANLHLVGQFEFFNEKEAIKVMKTRFPFRNGVGLGQHPILETI
jgi:hypothetical protein